ncbi:DJ-1/PfpI family protein [Kovacikia minuta CCNUW1]|uniref:DJ-1/PfpI family protein n=1 Tax=Kovacikia minuta TaxID=2931930 RepID=UPI001CCEF588|nr:DJ-1/PfpI family protein [Kovacikia minuta]UBF28825.1 DJ-1/PfpI family protein [Kovacikia minuta CCNUW1]
MKKVLVVTTSHDRFEGENPHPTGVWLEEFAVPYIELLKHDIELTVASPKGGAMPIDPRSLPTPEQKIEWQPAITAATQTRKLAEIQSEEFDAIFIPGGHGPMFDLPNDPDLKRLLPEFQQMGKLIASICHGPAGLVGAVLPNGTPLVKGKILTSYTDSEEVAAKLDQEVPFILENRLRELGAIFITGENKADHVERDGQLITGQNPNSSTSIALAIVAALTDQLPPIFTHTPEAIAPAQIIAEFPVNTFLENIAANEQGDLFVTSYEEGKIYRVTPAGKVEEYASIGGNLAGIAFEPEGSLLAAGTVDQTPVVYRIDQTGAIATLITLPDAVFLNGMTYLTNNRYLIADSFKGAIWEIDATAKTAQIWLQHERLAPSEAKFPPFPAANGLKVYNNTVYISNTQRQQLIRIPLQADYTAGPLEVFLTNVNLDDFAFDAEGNLYAATHVYNSVVRISPDGQVTAIAKAEQGMAGSTALAFGRTSADSQSLYVTTNGGMSLPLSDGVQSGKVVRLDVGIAGHMLIS